MPRGQFFFIGVSVVGALYVAVFLVGSRFGAAAGWLALLAVIPVSGWVFSQLPKPLPQTQEEKDHDERAWEGFFEKLLYRVGPIALGAWLLYGWLERH